MDRLKFFIIDRIETENGKEVAILESEDGASVRMSLAGIGCPVSDGDVLVQSETGFFVDHEKTRLRKKAAAEAFSRITKRREL